MPGCFDALQQAAKEILLSNPEVKTSPPRVSDLVKILNERLGEQNKELKFFMTSNGFKPTTMFEYWSRLLQQASHLHDIHCEMNRYVGPTRSDYGEHPRTDPSKLMGKKGEKDKYREINECHNSQGLPIPNIREKFQRLGTMHARYYAVLDLTSDYHQCAMSPSSRIFTAFVTHMGVFEWLRVPMGLKGAPSYFQRMMASIVLVGLLYVMCEVYIDDVLVFGRTEDEFITNLRSVFERLQKHRLTVNPAKCELGVTEIEYVGYVINEEGMSFSQEKKDSVLNFPKPLIQKQLKSFVGLTNYFHSHIPDHSSLTRPLNQMLKQYQKHKKLVWTVEATKAFEEIKNRIHTCQALTFLDANAEVHLKTDASDYGIGAYLYQKVRDKEQPVYFISKTLKLSHTRQKI